MNVPGDGSPWWARRRDHRSGGTDGAEQLDAAPGTPPAPSGAQHYDAPGSDALRSDAPGDGAPTPSRDPWAPPGAPEPWWAGGGDPAPAYGSGAPSPQPAADASAQPGADAAAQPGADAAFQPAAPQPVADAAPERSGLGWPRTSAPGPATAAPATSGPRGAGVPAYGAGDRWGDTAVYDTLGHAPRERRRIGGSSLVAAAAVIALVAGLLGGLLGAWVATRGGGRTVTLGASPRSSGPPAQRPADSIAGVAARVLPSVVSITVRTGNGGDTGSGFVISNDGYVLTNNHVVEAAAGGGGALTVELPDGRSHKATVVGRSQDYDLAVLKVPGEKLPALPIGDSDKVAVGDAVIAVGSPLGLSGTVTTGIISAEDRPVIAGESNGDSQSYINALQTDAAINPGNSGGPLVDAAGQVIGVNSAIATLGGDSPFGQAQTGSIGLGFAIPINQAADIASQLIKTGEVRYPIIGVSIDTRYTGDGAKIFDGNPGGSPAVQPGGPADKAGLQPGDVIVGLAGRTVTSGPELIVAIRTHKPGDQVQVRYVRGDAAPRTTTLTLGSAVERLPR